jgi:recombinational DNA repair protein (RecF pathway)
MRIARESTNVEGIVIRSFPAKDADLVLRCIVLGVGKRGIYARSVRGGGKKGRTKIPEVFDFIAAEVTDSGSELLGLRSIRTLKTLSSLTEDLHKITAASVLCEAYDFLILEGAPPEIDPYEPLLLGLSAIHEAGDLKGVLRGLYVSLGALLMITGYDHETRHAAPSLHNLQRMVTVIQDRAEKPLLSLPALEQTLQELME